jgi:hypothetical protein
MTALAQDFTIYAGDDAAPIIFVNDGSAAQVPINISTATEITWTIQRTSSSPILLTKRKSVGGGITLPNGGTDGKLQVNITAADSAGLTGAYIHVTRVTDATGKTRTTTLGAMRVGVPPQWTYDPTQLATSQKDQVRRLIGDVLPTDQQIFDEEINYALTIASSIYQAGAQCCRFIASQYARKVDTVQAELRIAYSTQQRNYEMRAVALDRIASIRGPGVAYAGGISIMDKLAQQLNSDAVPPAFNIGMTDNMLPVAPVGNVEEIVSDADQLSEP